eukprot:scaffold5551_cov119-Isochrysis_galbana.AAC.5
MSAGRRPPGVRHPAAENKIQGRDGRQRPTGAPRWCLPSPCLPLAKAALLPRIIRPRFMSACGALHSNCARFRPRCRRKNGCALLQQTAPGHPPSSAEHP